MDIDISNNNPESDDYALMNCVRNVVLFINLHDDIDDEQLNKVLTLLGNLEWCHIIKSKDGEYPLAYAKFSNEEAAKKALEEGPSVIPAGEGRKVLANAANLEANIRFCDSGKFMLLGIKDEVTEEEIKKIFVDYEQCNLPLYKIKKTEKNTFYFHTLTEFHMYCAWSIMSKSDMLIGPQVLTHSEDPDSVENFEAKRIVLKPYNLDPGIDNTGLFKMFEYLGNQVTRVLRDGYGNSRRCGYIIMKKPAEDTPLLTTFNAIETQNGNIRLEKKITKNEKMKSIENRSWNFPDHSKFYPSAIPPIQNKYYRIRDDYRIFKNHEKNEDGTKLKNSSLFLNYFNVHVSNCELYSQENLQEIFEKFGKLFNILIVRDGNTYAIITFLNVLCARKAVKELTIQRLRGETTIRAELIDCFQLYQAKINGNAFLENVGQGWNYTDYRVYRNFVYDIGRNGVIKRFPISDFHFILENLLKISKKQIELNKLISEEKKIIEKGKLTGKEKKALIEKDKEDEKILADCVRKSFSKIPTKDIRIVVEKLKKIIAARSSEITANNQEIPLFILKYLITEVREGIKFD